MIQIFSLPVEIVGHGLVRMSCVTDDSRNYRETSISFSFLFQDLHLLLLLLLSPCRMYNLDRWERKIIITNSQTFIKIWNNSYFSLFNHFLFLPEDLMQVTASSFTILFLKGRLNIGILYSGFIFPLADFRLSLDLVPLSENYDFHWKHSVSFGSDSYHNLRFQINMIIICIFYIEPTYEKREGWNS